MMRRQYLGDSCYAEFDGYGIWLTTNNGLGTTNKIYMEPAVLKALNDFIEYLKREVAAEAKEE